MFDCVEKKSLVKEESYYYDYEIKTTQDIYVNMDEVTSYELSTNGKCPQNCSHCNEKGTCIEGKENDKKEDSEFLLFSESFSFSFPSIQIPFSLQ